MTTRWWRILNLPEAETVEVADDAPDKLSLLASSSWRAMREALPRGAAAAEAIKNAKGVSVESFMLVEEGVGSGRKGKEWCSNISPHSRRVKLKIR